MAQECALACTAVVVTMPLTPIGPVATSLMPGMLLNEVRVWLPYNLLAFRFIPINIRPTSTAVVMLGWNVYLSHTSARDIPPEP